MPNRNSAVPDDAAATASAAVPDDAAATASAAVPDDAAAAASAAVPDNASAVSDHFTFNFPDQGEVATSPIEVEMTSVILSVPGTEHALPTNVLDHVVTALLDDWLV